MASIIWKDNRAYLNDIDLFGNVVEGSCEIKRKMIEVDGVGLPAGANVPSGRYEPVTASLNFNNIDASMIRQFTVQDGFVNLKMIGHCNSINALSGFFQEDTLTTIVRGFSDGIPLPALKASEAAEVEVNINVLFIEIRNTSGVLFMMDIANGLVYPQNVL